MIILTPGFAANEQDTTCLPAIQQYILATRKSFPGLSITVIAFQYPFIRSEYQWHGCRVIALGGKNRPGISRLLTWFKAWNALSKLTKRAPPLGVLSLWLSECSFIGKYFTHRCKFKHLMWIQGQDVKKSNQYIRRISPKSSHVVAISEFTQKEMDRNFGIRPQHIVENGINPDAFPSLNTKNRPIDILAAGSLIYLKRYDRIVEIVSELKKEFKSLKVGIAGEGMNEREIKDWCKRSGLTETITFYGSIPHHKVLDLMNNSRVFLHTSDYEGNSTVLIEALYSGCEVFSTQELSSRRQPHFSLCETNAQFVAKIAETLKQDRTPERVLFNDMTTSANKMVQLFRQF